MWCNGYAVLGNGKGRIVSAAYWVRAYVLGNGKGRIVSVVQFALGNGKGCIVSVVY